MTYYKDAKYFKESDMNGWSEERKAGQRELNWRIRLEHYAKKSQPCSEELCSVPEDG